MSSTNSCSSRAQENLTLLQLESTWIEYINEPTNLELEFINKLLIAIKYTKESFEPYRVELFGEVI